MIFHHFSHKSKTVVKCCYLQSKYSLVNAKKTLTLSKLFAVRVQFVDIPSAVAVRVAAQLFAGSDPVISLKTDTHTHTHTLESELPKNLELV